MPFVGKCKASTFQELQYTDHLRGHESDVTGCASIVVQLPVPYCQKMCMPCQPIRCKQKSVSDLQPHDANLTGWLVAHTRLAFLMISLKNFSDWWLLA